MCCNLLCSYNKRKKIFEWLYIDFDIDNINGVWKQLNYYFQRGSNRKTIVFGYEACCRYIHDVEQLLEDDKKINIESFSSFVMFKKYMKNLLTYICENGYTVAGPDLCDEYINAFDKFEKECDFTQLNIKKLLNWLNAFIEKK